MGLTLSIFALLGCQSIDLDALERNRPVDLGGHGQSNTIQYYGQEFESDLKILVA